jgi:hypothetical protein
MFDTRALGKTTVVISAQAGTQHLQKRELDPRLREDDGQKITL